MDRTESGNRKDTPDVDVEVKKRSHAHVLADAFERLGKLKYAILVFLAGVVILMFPQKEGSVPASAEIPALQQQTPHRTTESRISEILSLMDGAGRVEVMLTEKDDGETIYQTDTEVSKTDSSAETRVQTVFGRDDVGLVRQKNAPTYLGAVVLSQGGDDPDVQYRMKKATSSLTGLGADKITVLKMKSRY